jgi:hypothetical protein
VKAGRKTVRDGIASVVDPNQDQDLLVTILSVSKQPGNLLRQQLSAALGQVEPRHEIALGRNRVIAGR